MNLKELAAVNALVHQLNEVDEKIEAVKRPQGFYIGILGEYEPESMCDRIRPALVRLLEADRVLIIEALSALDVQV